MLRSWSLNVLGMLACIALLAAPAHAGGGPEKVFSGQIMMSEKPYPSSAKSASAYVAAIKKQSRTSFAENKENKGQWKIYFAAFLKAPLPDLEISVKLFELAGKQQKLLNSFEQYTDVRGQRTIISNLKLDKESVGVNKELMLVMDYKGKVLASGRFKITGVGEKATGKVDFNEDDSE